MCLSQRHNAVTPVRLKPASSRSRDKHSTTEPPFLMDVNIVSMIDINLTVKMVDYKAITFQDIKKGHK